MEGPWQSLGDRGCPEQALGTHPCLTVARHDPETSRELPATHERVCVHICAVYTCVPCTRVCVMVGSYLFLKIEI